MIGITRGLGIEVFGDEGKNRNNKQKSNRK
jgi:hypothetical protein